MQKEVKRERKKVEQTHQTRNDTQKQKSKMKRKGCPCAIEIVVGKAKEKYKVWVRALCLKEGMVVVDIGEGGMKGPLGLHKEVKYK